MTTDADPGLRAPDGGRVGEPERWWKLASYKPRFDRIMEALAAWRGSKLGLSAHLLVFGLAIVVPVLLYSAFVLHRFTLSERVSNRQRALEIARALSADIDREITAVITTLDTLATAGTLGTRDFEAFHRQAKEALKSRPWNVVVIDASRRQLVNTRLRLGAPLPMSAAAEPDLPTLTRDGARPVVSDLFIGTVARRPVFSVSVPVRVGDAVPYALVMSLDPERLVEILREASLPPGWIAAIADKKNVNMARSRMAGDFLGRPVPEESVRQYRGRPEGVITTTDLEGQRALQAFHFSRLTGWRVAAWAPLAVVEGQLRQAWTVFLWSGATLLSLSLLLALGVGRLMARPIAELASAGAALGKGKPVAAISSTLREADELSLVLAEAARELEARMGAQAHLAAIVSSSPSAVVSLSPDGIIRTWNAAAQTLFGYEPAEVIGRSVRMFYAEDAVQDFDKLNDSVRGGKTVYADVVRRHRDGRLLDVSISVAPMYDEAGVLVGISAIVRDIGERKARERHIEFLMRELAHRSKNLLAVVQAIAGQTARHSETLAQFQTRFLQRVHALARSQDLLVAREWRGVDLAELVRVQLAPFADETSSRVEVGGPPIQLRPDLVHAITLAVHELATNAAKYGALSVPEGHVAIAWETDDGSGSREPRFRISWRESNGPPVTPPSRRGFGHVVITDMVASSLRGAVTLDYAREGLRWTLDMPGASVAVGGDA